jgi:hypothetical protein
MEGIINKILEILKGSPALVFSLVVLYMILGMLGSKIDETNKILTDMNVSMTKSLERWEDEASDTKEFSKKQDAIYDLLIDYNK